jgi:WD40 repeat protein
VASWLYKVAYRVALRARSAAVLRQQWEAQAPAHPEPDPLEELTWRDLQTVVDEELGRLPEKFRAPLILCCLEGRSREEAAQQLGWSPGRLKGRLERGRQMLRSRLLRRGVTPSLVLGASLLLEGQAGAAVPATLREACVRAAVALQEGGSGMISAQAMVLMQATTQAMLRSKIKTVLALLLAATLFSAGAGTVAHQFLADKKQPTAVAEKNTGDPPQHAAEPAGPVDHHGDPLPAGAVARLGTTRFRHMHTISSLAYSADGSRLVSGSWDHTVRLWDAATGKELLRLGGQPEGFSSVAISPDGKLLAGGNMNRTLFVWNARTGKELYRREKLENTVFGLQFDAQGKTLAGVSGNSVRLWEAATGKELRCRNNTRDDLRPFAFSADLKTLVMGLPDGTIRLWDLTTGKERRLLDLQADLTAMAIGPDGKVLASAGGQRDGTVRLWDWATGREMCRFRPDRDLAVVLAFAADGKVLACGGEGGDIYIFDLTNRLQRCRCRLRAGNGVRALAFSPDGKALAVGGTDEKVIHHLDTTTGIEQLPLEGHRHEIIAAVPTPDGKSLLAASKDGMVCLWNLARGTQRHRWQAPMSLTALAAAPDGRSAVIAGDWKLGWLDLVTQQEIRPFADKIRTPDAVALSPDGRTLASASWGGHAIQLWDTATGAEGILIRLPLSNPNISGAVPLVFTRDGKILISGSADRLTKVIYFWDVATGKELHKIERPVSHLALSTNGRLLATTADDKIIRLWDVATRQERASLAADARRLAFSPDDRLLAYGGTDGRIHLWEIAAGQERCSFPGHQPGGGERGAFALGVSALAFTPDGRTLISGGGDTTLLLWDVYPRPQRPAKALDDLWTDLRANGPEAFAALGQLIAQGDAACSLLESKVPVAAACDRERLRKWIADLDSDQFAVRQRATQELEALNESAVPELRKALAAQPSVEARRRLEDVRRRLESSPSAEGLRSLRAVEALERIGTPKAQVVLQKLAAGAPEARLSQEARASVERLRRWTR